MVNSDRRLDGVVVAGAEAPAVGVEWAVRPPSKLLGSMGGSPARSAHSLSRSEQNAFKLKALRLPGVNDLATNMIIIII